MTASLVYNPYAFALHDDPYDTYRRLREEAPAYWNEELQFWVLSRLTTSRTPFATTRRSPRPVAWPSKRVVRLGVAILRSSK